MCIIEITKGTRGQRRFVDTTTGEIMRLDTALVAWRKSWQDKRHIYFARRRYGKKEKSLQVEQTSPLIVKDEEEDQRVEEIKYRGSRLDSYTWQWEDDAGVVHGSWLENKKAVAKIITAQKFKRSKEKIYFILPEKLKPTEKKICDVILTKEHINLKSGLVRYGNGVAMDTKAIMELAGISNRRTTQTALKGLIEKGVLRREVNNNKSVYYVSRHRYKIDTQLLVPCRHQLPSILAGSWGLFYDDHPILNTKTG